MADAPPFHWEFTPEAVTREVFRIEGGVPLHGEVPISGSKNAALKMFAAATLTGDRGRPGHGRDPPRPRRRRRPPGTERLRDRIGRRGVAVRAARGRGQDARL